MAFYATGDQQVRLRFSRYTEEVIKNDMSLFGETKENTFINKIIKNYYLDAKASIHMRLEEYQNTLLENLPPNIPENHSRAFVKAMTAAKKQELLHLISSYEGPDKNCKSKPYRLKNDIYCELTNEDSNFQENIYYQDSLARYIKILIEEYAREPYIRREQIYFKENFDIIAEALATNKQLLITISSGISFHTIPYKILPDPLATTNYLAGYSYGLHEEKNTKYTVSYKIAAIRKIRIEKSRSGKLCAEEISVLLKDIAEKGVQFLISDYVEIQVRLTEEGKKCFNRWLHLRPTPFCMVKEKESYLFTFRCGIYQAKSYFFKFGAQAEILSPLDLRCEFAEEYKKASARYLTESTL